MTNSEINDLIFYTEASMRMHSGDLSWGIRGTSIGHRMHMCMYFTYRGKDFINVLMPLNEQEDEVELITEICDLKTYVFRRTVLVMAYFGLANLVNKFAYSGGLFKYYLDDEYESGLDLDPNRLSMN